MLRELDDEPWFSAGFECVSENPFTFGGGESETIRIGELDLLKGVGGDDIFWSPPRTAAASLNLPIHFFCTFSLLSSAS
jgi:hypothetical protein